MFLLMVGRLSESRFTKKIMHENTSYKTQSQLINTYLGNVNVDFMQKLCYAIHNRILLIREIKKANL